MILGIRRVQFLTDFISKYIRASIHDYMQRFKAGFKYSNASTDALAVEWDEVQLNHRRKNRRGRVTSEEAWFIVGRQRLTGVMVGDLVASRNQTTCENVLMDYHQEGDVIMVDGWAGYSNMPLYGLITWANPHVHAFVNWKLCHIFLYLSIYTSKL